MIFNIFHILLTIFLTSKVVNPDFAVLPFPLTFSLPAVFRSLALLPEPPVWIPATETCPVSLLDNSPGFCPAPKLGYCPVPESYGFTSLPVIGKAPLSVIRKILRTMPTMPTMPTFSIPRILPRMEPIRLSYKEAVGLAVGYLALLSFFTYLSVKLRNKRSEASKPSKALKSAIATQSSEEGQSSKTVRWGPTKTRKFKQDDVITLPPPLPKSMPAAIVETTVLPARSPALNAFEEFVCALPKDTWACEAVTTSCVMAAAALNAAVKDFNQQRNPAENPPSPLVSTSSSTLDASPPLSPTHSNTDTDRLSDLVQELATLREERVALQTENGRIKERNLIQLQDFSRVQNDASHLQNEVLRLEGALNSADQKTRDLQLELIAHKRIINGLISDLSKANDAQIELDARETNLQAATDKVLILENDSRAIRKTLSEQDRYIYHLETVIKSNGLKLDQAGKSSARPLFKNSQLDDNSEAHVLRLLSSPRSVESSDSDIKEDSQLEFNKANDDDSEALVLALLTLSPRNDFEDESELETRLKNHGLDLSLLKDHEDKSIKCDTRPRFVSPLVSRLALGLEHSPNDSEARVLHLLTNTHTQSQSRSLLHNASPFVPEYGSSTSWSGKAERIEGELTLEDLTYSREEQAAMRVREQSILSDSMRIVLGASFRAAMGSSMGAFIETVSGDDSAAEVEAAVRVEDKGEDAQSPLVWVDDVALREEAKRAGESGSASASISPHVLAAAPSYSKIPAPVNTSTPVFLQQRMRKHIPLSRGESRRPSHSSQRSIEYKASMTKKPTEGKPSDSRQSDGSRLRFGFSASYQLTPPPRRSARQHRHSPDSPNNPFLPTPPGKTSPTRIPIKKPASADTPSPTTDKPRPSIKTPAAANVLAKRDLNLNQRFAESSFGFPPLPALLFGNPNHSGSPAGMKKANPAVSSGGAGSKRRDRKRRGPTTKEAIAPQWW